MARYLVTGIAGFIGFHLSKLLLERGHSVVGIDAFTPYYDVTLKRRRAAMLQEWPDCEIHEFHLEEFDRLRGVAADAKADIVVHLAAQAGVRYSLENPRAYVDSNLIGTFNVLETARAHPPRHLMIASTSSVYGANRKMPFAETDATDQPLTLYAATKKSCEAMAHSYSHLWGTPTTMFRFFTVYGPWGRPDMALFIFTRKILAGEPIDVYNQGNMQRDFTYVEDLVEAIAALGDLPPSDPRVAPDIELLGEAAPFRIVNIGHSVPVGLLDFIAEIEKCLGRKATKNMLPMQLGDVERTFASTERLQHLVGAIPSTSVETGVRRFVDWYRSYYEV